MEVTVAVLAGMYRLNHFSVVRVLSNMFAVVRTATAAVPMAMLTSTATLAQTATAAVAAMVAVATAAAVLLAVIVCRILVLV